MQKSKKLSSKQIEERFILEVEQLYRLAETERQKQIVSRSKRGIKARKSAHARAKSR